MLYALRRTQDDDAVSSADGAYHRVLRHLDALADPFNFGVNGDETGKTARRAEAVAEEIVVGAARNGCGVDGAAGRRQASGARSEGPERHTRDEMEAGEKDEGGGGTIGWHLERIASRGAKNIMPVRPERSWVEAFRAGRVLAGWRLRLGRGQEGSRHSGSRDGLSGGAGRSSIGIEDVTAVSPVCWSEVRWKSDTRVSGKLKRAKDRATRSGSKATWRLSRES